MANFVSFVRNDQRPVIINSEFVISIEPYRDDLTHSVIYTAGIGKGAADSRNYVVLGAYRAVAKMLGLAPVG